jgi:hypothetical protein
MAWRPFPFHQTPQFSQAIAMFRGKFTVSDADDSEIGTTAAAVEFV